MPIIQQTTIEEIVAGLPELEPLDDQLKRITERRLLISAAGFEDRARDRVERDGHIWESVLVITYPTNPKDNEAGLQAIEALSANVKPQHVVYARSTFWNDVRNFLDGLPGQGEGVFVVVDVSGMSSYAFYPLMEGIRRSLPRARLGIVYIEADRYHPEQQAWGAFRSSLADLTNPLTVAEHYQSAGRFESRGPAEVYASQIFPGSNPEPLATQLVVVPSFGLERIKEMIAFAEDQYNAARADMKWLYGNPPDRQKNGWRLEALLELYCAKDDPGAIPVSTRIYTEMFRALDDMWHATHLDRHMVIATVGSKMQHLATYLFLCAHPEVGLILSEPKSFDAQHYSDGIGPRWWLNLGRVQELSSLLHNYGHLRFSWCSD
ncbi:MAG TPA: hypothetical protein VFG04_22590 [Planctomycetaceae bacterium]|jgi:hypothetical protein|nr:hypothetical protein [Planctomycetaceae bacterium]